MFIESVAPSGDVIYVFHTVFLIPGSADKILAEKGAEPWYT